MKIEERDLDEAFTFIKNYAKTKNISTLSCGVVNKSSLIGSCHSETTDEELSQTVDINSQFRIASISKSFTAAAILRLRDNGFLELDQPVNDHIPNINFIYPFVNSPKVTVRQLLVMTSGLPNCDPWSDRKLDMSQEEIERVFTSGVFLSHTPGTNAIYSSFGYAILGQIVRTTTGINLQEYVSQNILGPLGMDNTTWEPKTNNFIRGYRQDTKKLEPYLKDGAIAPMGGLWTTVEDLSKWVSFYLDSYNDNSSKYENILKADSRLEQQKIWSTYSNSYGPSNHCYKITYGMGLGVSNTGLGMQISHLGGLPGYGSGMCWYPSYGIGLVILANSTYCIEPALLADSIKKIISSSQVIQISTVEPDCQILQKRVKQVIQTIKCWINSENDWDNSMFASNFFDDVDLEQRVHELQTIIRNNSFTINAQFLSNVEAALTIEIEGSENTHNLCMVLNPENPPKIQMLKLIDSKPTVTSDT